MNIKDLKFLFLLNDFITIEKLLKLLKKFKKKINENNKIIPFNIIYIINIIIK